jgi:hypothetical protein
MPSYISEHHAGRPEELSPLVELAEALLDQPLAAGVTIRNIAVVPRTGRWYVRTDAPEEAVVRTLFQSDSLSPVSVVEADDIAWRRLIALPGQGRSIEEGGRELPAVS